MHARDHTADELLTNSRQCRQIASNQCVTRTPGTETPAPHFSRKRSGRRPPTRFVVPRRHKLARCVRRERRTHDGKSQVIGCPEDRRGRFHHVAHAREIDCRIRFQRRVCIGIVRPKKQEYSLDKSKASWDNLDMESGSYFGLDLATPARITCRMSRLMLASNFLVGIRFNSSLLDFSIEDSHELN